jgi:hypothetical protein
MRIASPDVISYRRFYCDTTILLGHLLEFTRARNSRGGGAAGLNRGARTGRIYGRAPVSR